MVQVKEEEQASASILDILKEAGFTLKEESKLAELL